MGQDAFYLTIGVDFRIFVDEHSRFRLTYLMRTRTDGLDVTKRIINSFCVNVNGVTAMSIYIDANVVCIDANGVWVDASGVWVVANGVSVVANFSKV